MACLARPPPTCIIPAPDEPLSRPSTFGAAEPSSAASGGRDEEGRGTKKVAKKMKKAAMKKTGSRKGAARKKATRVGNLQRLERAGLVAPQALTAREEAVVEKMSKAEVAFMIRLRKKLGPVRKGRHPAKPNFPL